MKLAKKHCCICNHKEVYCNNPIVLCERCNVAVHLNCYGIQNVPENGAWFCRKCESQERTARVKCALCPNLEGAFKKTSNKGWCHVLCALHIPDVTFADPITLDVIFLDSIPQDRYNKTCIFCERNKRQEGVTYGVCIYCHYKNCKLPFHVTCAAIEGLLVDTGRCSSDAKPVRSIGFCSETHMKGFQGQEVRSTGRRSSPEKRTTAGGGVSGQGHITKATTSTTTSAPTPTSPVRSLSSVRSGNRTSVSGSEPSSKRLVTTLVIPPRKIEDDVKKEDTDMELDVKEEATVTTPASASLLRQVSQTSSTTHSVTEQSSSTATESREETPVEATQTPAAASSGDSQAKSVVATTPTTPQSDMARPVKGRRMAKLQGSSGTNATGCRVNAITGAGVKRPRKWQAPAALPAGPSVNPLVVRVPIEQKLLPGPTPGLGVGAAPSDRPLIFVPPYRAQSIRDTSNQPTAVGTAISGSQATAAQQQQGSSALGALPSTTTFLTMEDLLEWQWDQGGSLMMQQAENSDIVSLLSCLHQLKSENDDLEKKRLKLEARRDHLHSVNARLNLTLATTAQVSIAAASGSAPLVSVASSMSGGTSGVPQGQVIQNLLPQTFLSAATSAPVLAVAVSTSGTITSHAQHHPLPTYLLNTLPMTTTSSAPTPTSQHQYLHPAGVRTPYPAPAPSGQQHPGLPNGPMLQQHMHPQTAQSPQHHYHQITPVSNGVQQLQHIHHQLQPTPSTTSSSLQLPPAAHSRVQPIGMETTAILLGGHGHATSAGYQAAVLQQRPGMPIVTGAVVGGGLPIATASPSPAMPASNPHIIHNIGPATSGRPAPAHQSTLPHLPHSQMILSHSDTPLIPRKSI